MILPQLEKQVFDGTEHENAGNIQSIAPGVVEMAGIRPAVTQFGCPARMANGRAHRSQS